MHQFKEYRQQMVAEGWVKKHPDADNDKRPLRKKAAISKPDPTSPGYRYSMAHLDSRMHLDNIATHLESHRFKLKGNTTLSAGATEEHAKHVEVIKKHLEAIHHHIQKTHPNYPYES